MNEVENMNKKIIALQGTSTKGKSTTLKLLINLLSKKHYVDIIYDTKVEQVAIVIINDKKVGITTRGDTQYCLETDFKKLKNCDLYVCACRSKGETLDFLDKESKDGILLLHGKWYFSVYNGTYKDEENMRESINIRQANSIYEQILDLI